MIAASVIDVALGSMNEKTNVITGCQDPSTENRNMKYIIMILFLITLGFITYLNYEYSTLSCRIGTAAGADNTYAK